MCKVCKCGANGGYFRGKRDISIFLFPHSTLLMFLSSHPVLDTGSSTHRRLPFRYKTTSVEDAESSSA